MIRYKIYFRQFEQHYVNVEMHFSIKKEGEVQLYLPVWTPGSYMVREYARNLDQLRVVDVEGDVVQVSKVNKNHWVFHSKGGDSYTVTYRLYAYELTVRTNFVDSEQAMLNGAPTFLAVKNYEHLIHRVNIVPNDHWEVISTSMPMVNGNRWVREATCYDELVDSPIQIGNHEVVEFHAGGIDHELALIGPSNIDIEKTLQDLIAIVEEEVKLFGQKHPCDDYLFILHHTENTYGGLEHLASSLNMVPRWNYQPREKYLQTISLLSHEYFHLWNGKRIRPASLGPFDYSQENYSSLLWAIEGVTSFYDDYFVYLAGVCSEEEYLNIVAKNIERVLNTPGDTVQSLTEASFDAWIKYYRSNENSHNTQVSYYVKGAVVVLVLNILIITKSKGKKSFNDVMRALYQLYLSDPSNGYTETDLFRVFEEVNGWSLHEFYEQHINGVEPVDIFKYLSYAGLDLIEKVEHSLGWTLIEKGDRFLISKIEANSSIDLAGLNVHDEVIAIDDFRMNSSWKSFLHKKGVGDKFSVIVSRAGRIMTFEVAYIEFGKKSYSIEKIKHLTEEQLIVQKKLLPKK
ncbi:MAG TPA: hypothetical protein VFD65_05365 [Chitinophagales bacterium]|nr:hypothetical protein [Chitinophagales bacterium]